MKPFLVFPVLYYVFFSAAPARAEPTLPTTEQFHDALATCATGLNVTITTDLIGSITDIYKGQRSSGAASFSTATIFLELLPDADRSKVYAIYTQCITEILHPRSYYR